METRYVDQLMSRPVETVTPETSIREAADLMIEHDVGAVVAVEDGRLEGILTASDFVRFARNGAASSEPTVGELMRTDVLTTKRSAPVGEVAAMMLEHLIHHVPVVDGGDVVGVITSLDLAAQLATSR